MVDILTYLLWFINQLITEGGTTLYLVNRLGMVNGEWLAWYSL